jgi:hypothetical protein
MCIATAIWGNYSYNLITKFSEESADEMRHIFKDTSFAVNTSFSKVFGVPPSLNLFPNNSLVLFSDAKDVLFQQSSSSLLRLFEEMNTRIGFRI